jgi:GAF domain-containing protein
MLTRIRQLLSPPIFQGEEEKTRTARFINSILWAFLLLAIVISPMVIGLSGSATDRNVSIAIIGVMFPIILGLLWLTHRGRPVLASTFFLIFLLIVFTVSSIFFGGVVRSSDTAGYLLLIVMASLLLGRRGTIAFGITITVEIAILFWVEHRYESIPIIPLEVQSPIIDLFLFIGIFFMVALLMGFALNDLTETLNRARSNEQELTDRNLELRASRDKLQATTSNLERRNKQVRLASEIARDVSAAQDVEQLQKRAVILTKNRFDLYYTGLYLIDERRESAGLRAASGHGAERALEQGFQSRIGGKDALGQVLSTGRPYLVGDTEQDDTFVKHSLFPDTRSELILPLRVGNRIIGAFDFKAQYAYTFKNDDVIVFQTMVDQLAVAIENVRLLSKMQQTMREMEIASGRYTREAWDTIGRRTGKSLGYRYRGQDIEPAEEYPPEAREAWRQGRSVVITQPDREDDGQSGTNVAAVPIKFRDQVIAMLRLSSKENTISDQTISLVEEAADRLALALENARLLEETQQRAAREQLTRQVSEEMQRATEIDNLVQSTMQQLSDALSASHLVVHLGTEDELKSKLDIQNQDTSQPINKEQNQ